MKIDHVIYQVTHIHFIDLKPIFDEKWGRAGGILGHSLISFFFFIYMIAGGRGSAFV